MFTPQDIKSLQNLIGVLKRASFKDLTTAEALTVALSVQWVSELKEKLEKELSKKPEPEVKPETAQVEQPKKVKKK